MEWVKHLWRSRLWWLGSAGVVLHWFAYYVSQVPIRPRYDFVVYFHAASRVAQGISPYAWPSGTTMIYYYPPFLAHALAPLVDSPVGLAAFWWYLLAGAAVALVWVSLYLSGLGSTILGPMVAYFMLWTRPVQSSMVMGNVSLLVAALLAVSVFIYRRLPVISEILLGLTIHLKVVPGLAILWLLVASRRDRRAMTAAISGLMVAGLLLLLPWTGDYVRTCLMSKTAFAVRRYAGSNFSWDAYVASLGVELPQLIPVLVASLMVVVIGLKREADLVGWGIVHCMILVAMPVVWDHAFTLTFLPLAILIGVLVVHGSRIVQEHTWRGRILDAVIVIWFLSAIGNGEFYYIRSSFLRYALPLIPLLAPPGLAVSLWIAGKAMHGSN